MNNFNMGFSKADEISLRSNIDAGMQCPYIKEETLSRTSCALKIMRSTHLECQR